MQRVRSRPAFSLLELLVAATLMASMVTAAAMVLRSTQTSWTAHASDQERMDSALATLRHLTRTVRQAESITAISPPGDISGSLSVLLPTGDQVVWDHSATQVNYGTNTPTTLLAYGISELSFIGYEADGVTTTTTPGDVQSILCTVKIALNRSATPTRTLSSRIWLRAW